MKPVRVLNLFTIMNRGGAETMVMNYYRKINRERVQFDFLVHREEEGAYEKEIKELGGRIYRMPPMYPQNFSLYKKEIRKFFQEHPEYQIIHSHMSELGYFALKEAAHQGIPVRICHAHSSPHGFDMKMIMRNYFKKMMIPYLTHMFMCGKESGDWLFGKENEQRFIQLNNAIDTKQFLYNKEIELEIRKELGVENQFIVGHVGGFSEAKNHRFLLEIFCEIVKRKEDAVLLLVGNGKLFEEMKERVERLGLSHKVKFLGLRTDIYRIMQCFQVFLFPSLFEGLPVTMVEAQAAGNLCFISDTIPRQCCITDNVRIVSLKNTPEEWAEKIIEEERHYQKRNMYEKIVEEGFDIDKNAEWLEEFYIEAARN